MKPPKRPSFQAVVYYKSPPPLESMMKKIIQRRRREFQTFLYRSWVSQRAPAVNLRRSSSRLQSYSRPHVQLLTMSSTTQTLTSSCPVKNLSRLACPTPCLTSPKTKTVRVSAFVPWNTVVHQLSDSALIKSSCKCLTLLSKEIPNGTCPSFTNYLNDLDLNALKSTSGTGPKRKSSWPPRRGRPLYESIEKKWENVQLYVQQVYLNKFLCYCLWKIKSRLLLLIY